MISALRDEALRALRDIVIMPELRDVFQSEPGWGTSLFRHLSENEGFFELARVLIAKDYSALPAHDLQLAFHPSGWAEPVDFTFKPFETEQGAWPTRPQSGPRHDLLPSRLIAVIGRNGSGKSTLLARLARVAVASKSARSLGAYRQIGTMEPAGLGFTRVVTISYSAFDSFEIPGVNEEERKQVIRELDQGNGRYVFCGLRDIARETDVSPETDAGPADRRDDAQLKPLSRLADEFARLVQRVRDDRSEGLLARAMEPLLRDPSFNDLAERTLAELLGDDPRQAFMSWSTGHKIVLHVIASLAAHIQPRSLVLFDEPETHLHPPLLAGLMHALRFLLEERSAFGVVATHSPVVLQETLAANVIIVRREGQLFSSQRPELETFGENAGTITYSVFGLSSEATDFHRHLDRLIDQFKDLESIEAVFPEGLSHQARAYVMSCLYSQTPVS